MYRAFNVNNKKFNSDYFSESQSKGLILFVEFSLHWVRIHLETILFLEIICEFVVFTI